jgi:hypothetical protein
MSHSSKSSFLEEAIGLLVQHFGIKRVRAALPEVAIGGDEETQKPPRRSVSCAQKPPRPPVANALESIRGSDPEKHRLLSEFLGHLKNREILPESQDIRLFAQLIGLKDIGGKSRRDMIPALMRFLLEQPTERLRIDLQNAANISEQQRQQGFSVLTDKLLGEK